MSEKTKKTVPDIGHTACLLPDDADVGALVDDATTRWVTAVNRGREQT